MRGLRALGRDRSGAITMLGAAALTFALGALAFAVDLGSLYFQTRRLQGAADAAALAAVTNLAAPEGIARATIAANGWTGAYALTLDTGGYHPDATRAPADRFVAGEPAPNAARVRIEADAPLFFGIAALGRGSLRIARTATATRADMAAFSLGSRLAALDGGVANALLGALTGSQVNLSVMDYNALLGADVDLFAFAGALQTQAGVQAGTFDDALAGGASGGGALGALASALDAGGSGAAAAAVRRLAGQAGGGSVPLSRLIDLGAAGAQDRVAPGGAIKVNAWDLITAMLQLASGGRQVQLDLGATVPGLSGVTAKLAVGDRAVDSPWLALTDKGTPIVRTAQTRLYVEATVAPAANMLGLGSVRLPVYVELAAAEAKLASISCAGGRSAETVGIDVHTGVGHASIADLSPADLSDHRSALAESPARIAATPLLTVTGQARIDLSDSGWQSLLFTADDIAARRVKTVSSNGIARGIAGSLASRVTLTASAGGVTVGAGPVTSLAGGALTGAAPALDAVIDSLTGLLGLHLGQADVRVNGARCGVPALVG